MSSSSVCADRLKQLPPALSAWITLLELEHWQELQDACDEGRDKASRETTAAMIRRTDLDDETIAAITGLDATEIAALRRVGG
jgi:hypothetical protein